MAETIRVEVAYAEPQRQFLRALEVPAGTTLEQAIGASGLADAFGIDVDTLEAGIWSKRRDRGTVLGDGDRVELYRPLVVDPKEARRRRAVKRTG
ncbi:RnfH family protein [Dokdonella sp. MW10]|uniref:RnfH family protein n=1 Tax=Dokdonella sp. MW10 TaxID=2992926 RepID=UPI003F8209CB